ncbi:MAG: LapA family protein [Pseudomonadota bacterium]
MRYLKVLAFVLIFFVTMMFFVQNNDVLQQIVTLKLDFFINPAWSSIPLPFYFMVLAAFLIGCLCTMLLLIYDRLRLANNLRKANKRIRILEKEVNSLRTLPLTENAEAAPAEEIPVENAEK